MLTPPNLTNAWGGSEKSGGGTGNGRGLDPGIGAEVAEASKQGGASAGRKVVRHRSVPFVKLMPLQVGTGTPPQLIEVGKAAPDRRIIFGNEPELFVCGEPCAGQVGRSDDRPAGVEYIELGVKAANAADGAAGIEQQPQGSDVARAIREICKIEPGDDPEGCGPRLENPRKSAGLDERAHDAEFAGMLAQTCDELGVPAFGYQAKCQGEVSCFRRS